MRITRASPSCRDGIKTSIGGPSRRTFATAAEIIASRLVRTPSFFRRPPASSGVRAVWRVGNIPFDRESAPLVFALISSRYQRRSMIGSSNKTFSVWAEIFLRPGACRDHGRLPRPSRRGHRSEGRQIPHARQRRGSVPIQATLKVLSLQSAFSAQFWTGVDMRRECHAVLAVNLCLERRETVLPEPQFRQATDGPAPLGRGLANGTGQAIAPSDRVRDIGAVPGREDHVGFPTQLRCSLMHETGSERFVWRRRQRSRSMAFREDRSLG